MTTRVRSKRAGQRRAVLAKLRDIKSDVSGLQRSWDVRATVYVEPADRTSGSNLWRRNRREDEYPENMLTEWAYLYNVSDELIKELTELRTMAANRFYEIKNEQASARRAETEG